MALRILSLLAVVAFEEGVTSFLGKIEESSKKTVKVLMNHCMLTMVHLEPPSNKKQDLNRLRISLKKVDFMHLGYTGNPDTEGNFNMADSFFVFAGDRASLYNPNLLIGVHKDDMSGVAAEEIFSFKLSWRELVKTGDKIVKEVDIDGSSWTFHMDYQCGKNAYKPCRIEDQPSSNIFFTKEDIISMHRAHDTEDNGREKIQEYIRVLTQQKSKHLFWKTDKCFVTIGGADGQIRMPANWLQAMEESFNKDGAPFVYDLDPQTDDFKFSKLRLISETLKSSDDKWGDTPFIYSLHHKMKYSKPLTDMGVTFLNGLWFTYDRHGGFFKVERKRAGRNFGSSLMSLDVSNIFAFGEFIERARDTTERLTGWAKNKVKKYVQGVPSEY